MNSTSWKRYSIKRHRTGWPAAPLSPARHPWSICRTMRWSNVKPSPSFSQRWAGCVLCAATAMFGMTILLGLSGQVSLGNGALMAVGGYIFALTSMNWQTVPILGTPWNAVWSMVFAGFGGVVFGAAIGGIAARLRGPCPPPPVGWGARQPTAATHSRNPQFRPMAVHAAARSPRADGRRVDAPHLLDRAAQPAADGSAPRLGGRRPRQPRVCALCTCLRQCSRSPSRYRVPQRPGTWRR